MGKILLVLMFVAGLVSSNDHLNLFENTQKLSNISSVDAPKVEELDQRKLRITVNSLNRGSDTPWASGPADF